MFALALVAATTLVIHPWWEMLFRTTCMLVLFLTTAVMWFVTLAAMFAMVDRWDEIGQEFIKPPIEKERETPPMHFPFGRGQP